MNTLSLKDALLQVSATLSYYAGGINGAPTKISFIKTNKEDQFYAIISIGVAPLAQYALIVVSGNQVMITHCDMHGTYSPGGLPLKFLLVSGITQEFITGTCQMIISHRVRHHSLYSAAEEYYTNYEKRIESERLQLLEEVRLQKESKKRELQERQKEHDKLHAKLIDMDHEIDELFTKKMIITEKMNSINIDDIPDAPLNIQGSGNFHKPQTISF